VGPILSVLVGGAIGTGLRLMLDDVIVHHDNTFPLSTLLINAVGSFVLAIFITRVWDRAPAWLRAGLGPGLMGGFTTFSAVMTSLVTLTATGHVLLALGYLLLSLVLGLGAAALGFRVGRRPGADPVIEVDE
jgi:CrcB protein